MTNKSHSSQHGLVGNIRPKSSKTKKINKLKAAKRREQRREITEKN